MTYEWNSLKINDANSEMDLLTLMKKVIAYGFLSDEEMVNVIPGKLANIVPKEDNDETVIPPPSNWQAGILKIYRIA